MNAVQMHLTQRLIELVAPPDVGDVVVNITKGPSDVTVEFGLSLKSSSIWIDQHGVSIVGPGVDERYEAHDYADEAGLIDTVLASVRDMLEVP
jgi:hypothetical protein